MTAPMTPAASLARDLERLPELIAYGGQLRSSDLAPVRSKLALLLGILDLPAVWVTLDPSLVPPGCVWVDPLEWEQSRDLFLDAGEPSGFVAVVDDDALDRLDAGDRFSLWGDAARARTRIRLSTVT